MSVLFQPIFAGTSVAAAPFQILAPYPKVLTTSNDQNTRTYVIVTPIDITGFTKFRVTLHNGTDASATITTLYLGQLTSTYSFASAPTQATFGGGSSTSCAFTLADESVVSNTISYTPSGAGTLCISFHVAANNSLLRFVNNNGTGWAAYSKSGADDSSTQSKTGYAVNGTQRTSLITLVEAAP